MRISEILTGKGSDVVHALPDTSVRALVGLLREHNLGAVVVSPTAAASSASCPSATWSATSTRTSTCWPGP